MAETSNTNKIPFRHLLLQYTNTALNILFPLILFPYMTRTLGPQGYGVIGYYESLMLVVNVWAAFGVNYFGLRLLSKSAVGDANHANTVLHLLFINGFMAFTGTVCYLLYIISKPVQIGSPGITLLYAYIMLVYMFHADWYFQSQEKFRFLLNRTFVLRLFVLVSAIIFVRKPEHLIYYIMVSAVNYTLIAASTWWNLRSLLPYWKWDIELFKKLIRSLWPFALLGVLSSFYFSLDTIILARTGKVADLGHYTVAAKIVRLGLNVFIGASIVFFVKLFRSAVDRKLQEDSMLMTMHLSIPIGALLFAFANPVIRFVSGVHYLPATDILRIFSLLWVVVPLHDFFTIQVLMVHHREKLLVRLYAIASLVSLFLNIILIPLWFTQGAAIAMLVTEVVVLVVAVIYSRDYFRLNSSMVIDFLSCLTAFPIAWLGFSLAENISQNALVQLTVGLTVSCLAYAIVQVLIFSNDFWSRMWQALRAKWLRTV
ncbi:oligosaccharide flippase family protein [Flavihumibacter solisilvae]|uniref:oligosaccharide flippase family protein n=1 Tax=Flavihumibacter solisilvae TaxID=1349421 RepID=UPI00057CFB77|nr:oligosaccharide flippase family protein [Flavihumibacter solisilvae]